MTIYQLNQFIFISGVYKGSNFTTSSSLFSIIISLWVKSYLAVILICIFWRCHLCIFLEEMSNWDKWLTSKLGHLPYYWFVGVLYKIYSKVSKMWYANFFSHSMNSVLDDMLWNALILNSDTIQFFCCCFYHEITADPKCPKSVRFSSWIYLHYFLYSEVGSQFILSHAYIAFPAPFEKAMPFPTEMWIEMSTNVKGYFWFSILSQCFTGLLLHMSVLDIIAQCSFRIEDSNVFHLCSSKII